VPKGGHGADRRRGGLHVPERRADVGQDLGLRRGRLRRVPGPAFRLRQEGLAGDSRESFDPRAVLRAKAFSRVGSTRGGFRRGRRGERRVARLAARSAGVSIRIPQGACPLLAAEEVSVPAVISMIISAVVRAVLMAQHKEPQQGGFTLATWSGAERSAGCPLHPRAAPWRCCSVVGEAVRLADRLDAPHLRRELHDLELLRGLALGAFHGNDGRERVVFHHVFAAARENGTQHSFSARHQ